jgi:hypothetical protein
VREARIRFTVIFYGSPNFCCKTSQLHATRCKSDSLGFDQLSFAGKMRLKVAQTLDSKKGGASAFFTKSTPSKLCWGG